MTAGQVVSPILSDPGIAARSVGTGDSTNPFPEEPSSDVLHDMRARDAEEAGDTFAALWHLDRLAVDRSRDWLVQARRGHALLMAGDVAGAETAYRIAEADAADPKEMRDWYRAKADAMDLANRSELAKWYRERRSR